MLYKVFDFFGYIENNDDADNDQQGDEEGQQELLHYVAV